MRNMNAELIKIGNDKLTRGALEIVRTLNEHGYSAYFAGGCVRDMLLGKPAYDIDIATSALPDEILKIFPKCLKIGEAFGIINVVIEDIN
jgi:tRNA nucleotidyltransferase/poly(A) polymerase